VVLLEQQTVNFFTEITFISRARPKYLYKFQQRVPLDHAVGCKKPNSITLAGSELAANKLRTSFERASN